MGGLTDGRSSRTARMVRWSFRIQLLYSSWSRHVTQLQTCQLRFGVPQWAIIDAYCQPYKQCRPRLMDQIKATGITISSSLASDKFTSTTVYRCGNVPNKGQRPGMQPSEPYLLCPQERKMPFSAGILVPPGSRRTRPVPWGRWSGECVWYQGSGRGRYDTWSDTGTGASYWHQLTGEKNKTWQL